jgi:hypothetical protein
MPVNPAAGKNTDKYRHHDAETQLGNHHHIPHYALFMAHESTCFLHFAHIHGIIPKNFDFVYYVRKFYWIILDDIQFARFCTFFSTKKEGAGLLYLTPVPTFLFKF